MTSIRSIPRRTQRSFLRPRQALRLENAQGTIIVVERGCLWVTLEHDPRDIVLGVGMRFEIDRPGRTVASAETDTTLRLLRPVSRRERIATALAGAVASLYIRWAGRGRRAAPHA